MASQVSPSPPKPPFGSCTFADWLSPAVVAVHSTVWIVTTRAIFSIGNWDNLPNDPYHGLKLNSKCWPSQLAPDDPGWVLLTNDEFYSAGQYPASAVHIGSYRDFPDMQRPGRSSLPPIGVSPP